MKNLPSSISHLPSLRWPFIFSSFLLLLMCCVPNSNVSAQTPNCPVPSGSVELFYASVNTATVYTNQTIHITGTVSFNANVTMTACTVLMEPNAILNITNNTVFTMLASSNGVPTVVKGCTAMWNSINVLAGGAVDWRNSVVRDGMTALTVANNFRQDLSALTNMTFTANSVAIAANGVSNFSFVTFTGNTFIGRDLGAPNLLPPPSALQPIYALRLDNVSGSVGTAGAVNTFRRNSVAIRVENSALTVNNATFQDNIIQDWEGFGSGVGIWATNSSLTIKEFFSGGYSCSFIGNRRGLRSDRTVALVLENANFQNERVIDVEVINSNQPNNVRLFSNRFTLGNPTERAIFVERSAQKDAIHTEIRSNILNLPHGGNWLANNIRFIEVRARAGAIDQAQIVDNQIRCDYGNTAPTTRTIDGIWVEDPADGYYVAGNIINYQSADARPNARIESFGITMRTVNGVHNDVGPNNTITSTRYTSTTPDIDNFMETWLRCGIHIESSTNVRVCRNDVDDARHDYHFDHDCSNGEFGRNKIRDAYQGLAISGMFPIIHNYRKNEWIPGSFYNERSARWATVAPVRWRVDGNFPGQLPNLPSPSTWFVNMPNGGIDSSNCSNLGGNFDKPPTDKLAKRFLNNEYPELNTPMAIWDFERNLLAMMIRFPETYVSDATAQSYYNSRVNTSTWKFARAERMLHEAAAVSSDQQQYLDNLHDLARATAYSLANTEIEEGKEMGTISPTLQAQKKQLLADAAGLQQELSLLNKSIQDQQASQLVAVRSYVQSLPEADKWEQYYKIILQLQAKRNAGESWTAQDTATIRLVAYACPTIGGQAVTIARGMLPAPETNRFAREGDDPQCLSYHSAPVRELPALSAGPNPANDRLNIVFREPFTGSIQLLSAAGQVLQAQQADEWSQHRFDTSSLPAGLYLLRIQATGQYAQTLKISILH